MHQMFYSYIICDKLQANIFEPIRLDHFNMPLAFITGDALQFAIKNVRIASRRCGSTYYWSKLQFIWMWKYKYWELKCIGGYIHQ